eukprot:3241908-Pleurochrysis_carterae.AAC.1
MLKKQRELECKVGGSRGQKRACPCLSLEDYSALLHAGRIGLLAESIQPGTEFAAFVAHGMQLCRILPDVCTCIPNLRKRDIEPITGRALLIRNLR